MSENDRISIQLRLPSDLHREVVAYAQFEDRSLNWELIHLVRLGLDAKRKQLPLPS